METNTKMTVTFEDGSTESFIYGRDYNEFKIVDGTFAIYLHYYCVAVYAHGVWKTVKFSR